MHKFIVIAGTLAVAATWSFAPALAQTTTTEPMERKAEKAADKADDKADATKDTMKDKAVRTKDKVKDSLTDAKDKMRDKVERADARMAMTDTRAAQDALRTQGFDPGPVDGRMGPRTSAALSDYQRKNDLPVTGRLDDATMAKLNIRSSRGTDVPAASPTTQPDPKKQNP
jgi:peptidoglycan hydrolase-like protein with peptidoglycan-binding domain